MQKRNDYVRYKALRKINRRRKADQEKQSKIAEKELKKRLRFTPRKFEDGLNPGYVRQNNDPIAFDPNTGELLDQITGERGTMIAPEIVVSGRDFKKQRASILQQQLENIDLFELEREIARNEDALRQYDINKQNENNLASRFEENVANLIPGAGYVSSGLHYVKSGLDYLFGDKGAYQYEKERAAKLAQLNQIPTLLGTVAMTGNVPLMTGTDALFFGDALRKADQETGGFRKTSNISPETAIQLAFSGIGLSRNGLPVLGQIGREQQTFVKHNYYNKHPNIIKPNSKNYIELNENGSLIRNIGSNIEQSNLPVTKHTVQQLPYLPVIKYNIQQTSSLPYKQSLIKPKIIQSLPLRFSMSDIVSKSGDINTKNVTQILRQIANDVGDIKSNSQHHRRKDGLQTTLRHLWESAKTAKSAPIPRGSTKQEQVFSALSHDIGELYGRQNHQNKSISILDKYIDNVPDNVRNAVMMHMDNNVPFLSDNVKALRAADVGSGLHYDQLIKNEPYLGYISEEPMTNFGKNNTMSVREVLKNKINPYFDSINLQRIPLDATEQEARQMIRDNMRIYRTVGRGLSLPKYDNRWEDINRINNENSIRLAQQATGKQDVSVDDIYNAMVTHAALADTKHGKAGFDKFMDALHISTKEDSHQPIYTSNTKKVLAGYSGNSNLFSDAGRAMLAEVPEVYDENMSLADIVLANEWPLYSPYTNWLHDQYNYFTPYRLVTGRSLNQDIKKFLDSEEGIQYKNEIQTKLNRILDKKRNLFKHKDRVNRFNDIMRYHMGAAFKPIQDDIVTPSIDNTVERYNLLQQLYGDSENRDFIYNIDKMLNIIYHNFPEETFKKIYTDIKKASPNIVLYSKIRNAIQNSSLRTSHDVDLVLYTIAREKKWKIGPNGLSLKEKEKAQQILQEYLDVVKSVNDYSDEVRQHLNEQRLKDIFKSFSLVNMSNIPKYYFDAIKADKKRRAINFARSYDNIFHSDYNYKNSSSDIGNIRQQLIDLLMKKNNVLPMSMTNEIRNHPYAFTTEGLRKNVSKQEIIKRNQLNYKLRDDHQHYVFVGENGQHLLDNPRQDKTIKSEKHRHVGHGGKRYDILSPKLNSLIPAIMLYPLFGTENNNNKKK